MKILYITTHLNRGGIVSYLSSLAIELKKIGHDIIVASSGGDIENVLSQAGIKHIRISIRTKKEISPSVLFSFFSLKKYLSKNPVDIIHAHTRVAQVLAFLLSKRFKIPLVTTCHGFFRPRWHRRKFPCWGDKVVAISRQVKDHLISDFKVKEKDIRLIHSGVDLARFRDYTKEEISLIKSEIGLNPDNFVIGSAGRFSRVKGLEYFIKAIPAVLKNKQRVSFLLMGYGKDESRLRKIVRDLDVEGKIIFYRPSGDISRHLCVMDVFVMPSIQEGLGLSLLEAQAQKIPVIASDVGGIPDVIQDGLTGLLVKPADSSVISSAILRLIQSPQLCENIKYNAYDRLKEEFSLFKMIDETEKVYKELL